MYDFLYKERLCYSKTIGRNIYNYPLDKLIKIEECVCLPLLLFGVQFLQTLQSDISSLHIRHLPLETNLFSSLNLGQLLSYPQFGHITTIRLYY